MSDMNRIKFIYFILFLSTVGLAYGGKVMTEISVTIDSAKPITISALLVDSTQMYINDKAMKQIFGKEAHLQVTEKSILACVEDLCVPYSKKTKKNEIMEEKGQWYIRLDSFCQTIGKFMQWSEPGKSVEIKTIRK